MRNVTLSECDCHYRGDVQSAWDHEETLAGFQEARTTQIGTSGPRGARLPYYSHPIKCVFTPEKCSQQVVRGGSDHPNSVCWLDCSSP